LVSVLLIVGIKTNGVTYGSGRASITVCPSSAFGASMSVGEFTQIADLLGVLSLTCLSHVVE
jgi:hypothetical protein